MTIVLILIDPVLALVGLTAAPLLAVTTVMKRRRTERLQRVARQRQGQLQAAASDLLRNARAIQGLGAEQWAVARYEHRAELAVDASIDSLEFSARVAPAADLILAIVSAAVLWLGVLRVSSGRLSVGSLLVVFSYLSGLYSPVRELARLGNVMARTAASRDRLAEIFTHPLPPERLLELETTASRGVSVRGVSFAYQDGPSVLENVTLRVRPGEHVCIVGPSGVGKTTLLHLLVRLYEPSSGAIEIDGLDVRDRSMQWLRTHVALVPQDCWILDATLRENLVLDTSGIDDAVIAKTLQLTLLDEVVARMPEGLDTRLGEGGARLSGGERRRVALARALLRGSEILLLDEPTSGLDSVSERLVAESLRSVARYRTLLSVTHSPVIAEIADRVFEVRAKTLVALPARGARFHLVKERHERAG